MICVSCVPSAWGEQVPCRAHATSPGLHVQSERGQDWTRDQGLLCPGELCGEFRWECTPTRPACFFFSTRCEDIPPVPFTLWSLLCCSICILICLSFLSLSRSLCICKGDEIQPYLPTLMETMLSALCNSESLKLKELSVSAIGAIGNEPALCGPGVFRIDVSLVVQL